MPAKDRMPSVWSRRSILAALMVGSMAAVTGCGVRLEDDAPRIPGLPARKPMPDEQALLRARHDALRLQDLAAGLASSSTRSTPLTQLLATVHGQQAVVLESVLRAGGVPPDEITSEPTAGAPTAGPPTATAQSTAAAGGAASAPVPAPSGVTGLINAEAEGLAAQALSDLTLVSRDRVALLGSMTAQRAAAVRLLGGRLPLAAAPTGPTGEVAAAQLEAFRSAVYGFEVVVAQADVSHRKAAAKTLGALRARSSELQLLAGSAAGPIPLGYTLPFPVANPASALRLATHLMTTLRAAIASQLPGQAGDAPGLTGTIQALAEVCVHAVTWRVPLTAFPGLTNT